MLDAIGEFGARDAFDVALSSVLLAVGISWLRRSRAALVAVGIAVLACLYSAAVGLGLGLTSWLFQGFFAALALVLVVLFQDELRQAFEELAAWVLGRRDDYRPRLDAPDILVEALGALAQRRVGALVVLPGVQKLDRHLHGGEALGGRMSRALLESLFDPGSDGHDGAVVVESGRVVRFGVQLPLTRNTERLARGGTRHSAALGLAERTDALCLVVSEERGTIMAARAGRLREVHSDAELKAAIDRFHRKRRGLSRRGWRGWLRERPAELAGAVGLALLLWGIFVAGARPGEQVWSVPVRVLHAPEGTTLSHLEPAEVPVRVSGTRRALAWTSRDEIVVSVDASSVPPGGGTVRLALDPAAVRHPARLAVEALAVREVSARFLPAVAAAAAEGGAPSKR